MLQHLDKNRGIFLKTIKLATTNSNVNVKKVLTYNTTDGEAQVYPEPATHLRVESNYDTSINTKTEEGKAYGHPVITPAASDYEALTLTITPFPANSGWKLVSNNFTLSESESAVHYGVGTITLQIPNPATIGYHLHQIQVTPEFGTTEPVTFSFYSAKHSESQLTPTHWWSFDDETLVDKVAGTALVQLNETASPLYVDGALKKALQAVYLAGGDSPNIYRATINPAYGDNGLSISGFGRFNRGGEFGFIDTTTTNGYAGNYFSIRWSYRQPTTVLTTGYSQTVPNTNTEDRLDTTKWHHLALTLSKPIDTTNYPGFVVDYAENEFGTIVYTSPDVAYDRTLVNTAYTNYFTYNIRLAKFYINGNLKAEMLLVIKANEVLVPGAGVFGLSFQNTVEQDGANPDRLDELKVFEKELTLTEIRSECALIGLQFFSESEDPIDSPVMIARNGRTRTIPADLTSIPLTCHMKPFLIDNQTIAIGCSFREFFMTRLLEEFPNLDATEYNYRHGFVAEYIRYFHHMYAIWELYEDYQPILVAALDDVTKWAVDTAPIQLVGRWQNSTGEMRIPDFLDGTSFIKTDAADLIHFGYLRLATPMTEGSTHTITWNGNETTLIYDREQYASSIKVNQEGYLPEAGRKYAYFGSWLGTGGAYQHALPDLTFHLIEVGATEPTYTGTMTLRTTSATHLGNGITYQLTGEIIYTCDFSDFVTEGEYQIYIPGVGYSHKFVIGQAALGKAFWTHCRGMFHQRSGCPDVKAPYTNWEYQDAAHYWTWESKFICDDKTYDQCVTPDGITYPTLFSDKHFSMIPNNVTGRVFRDLRGGWFDAADFDRRPYHFKCVRDLIEPYLRFPQNFTDNQLDIPESGNGIPDLLCEAEWGLDVWRRGQHLDGGIAAWIEASGHEADWPWRSNKRYYIGLPNRKDSLEYAQCAAKLARALRIAGTPEALKKSVVYTESAIRAFNFGVDPTNATHFTFSQKTSSNVLYDFEYNELASRADRLIVAAAAALFVLTKEPRFAKEINTTNIDAHYTWMANDANEFAQTCISELLFDLDKYFPEFCNKYKTFIIGKADLWKSYQEQQAYHEVNWPPNHGFYNHMSWGVVHPETRGKAYIYAWLLTGDTTYRDSAILALDSVMGCNAMGRCLTTGLGKVSPVHFLNSWLPRAEIELGIYEPVPGITPYTHIGDNTGKSCQYGFCLYKGSRDDMGFSEIVLNILPMGLTSSVPNSRGAVAMWLQQNWPLWRQVFEMEDYSVAQSEFTISETMSGKAFLTGCLMGEGFTPDPTWKARIPQTDKYAVEGLIYLP